MNDKIDSIDFEKIFQNISMKWFYTKPLLFSLMCLYELKPEYGIECDFRTNGKIIEYNPESVADKSLQNVKDSLELELCRIMLRHPYRKKPENTDEEQWYKASTITITQKSLSRYNLPENQNIEFYYAELMKQKAVLDSESMGGSDSGDGEKQSGKNDKSDGKEAFENETETIAESKSQNPQNEQNQQSNGNSENEGNSRNSTTDADKKSPTAFWGEDESTCNAIEDFIKENLTVQLWGEIPGSLESLLKAEAEKFSYFKTVLNYFKASISKGDRTLTRMKPNRRSGFLQMGSRHKAKPGKILVAIDTSESVSDKYLERFYGALKSIYLQGIKKIEVIQFDHRLLNEKAEKFTRKAFYKIKGRGGTSFQCVFDFVKSQHQRYDGLIIFTDGYAPQPRVQKSALKVLWMLTEKNGFKPWMSKTGIYGWL